MPFIYTGVVVLSTFISRLCVSNYTGANNWHHWSDAWAVAMAARQVLAENWWPDSPHWAGQPESPVHLAGSQVFTTVFIQSAQTRLQSACGIRVRLRDVSVAASKSAALLGWKTVWLCWHCNGFCGGSHLWPWATCYVGSAGSQFWVLQRPVSKVEWWNVKYTSVVLCMCVCVCVCVCGYLQCLYICVYICVCMFAMCMYIHVCVCVCVCVYLQHVCTCVCVCVCVHACMCVCMCGHLCACKCVRAYVGTCVFVCECVCMFVCVCVCVCVCVYHVCVCYC